MTPQFCWLLFLFHLCVEALVTWAACHSLAAKLCVRPLLRRSWKVLRFRWLKKGEGLGPWINHTFFYAQKDLLIYCTYLMNSDDISVYRAAKKAHVLTICQDPGQRECGSPRSGIVPIGPREHDLSMILTRPKQKSKRWPTLLEGGQKPFWICSNCTYFVNTKGATTIFFFRRTSLLHTYLYPYCIVLYRIVLYCNVLHCIALYCIGLYCSVLHCIALYCHWIVLYCIALHCIVLYCIVSYCIVLMPVVHVFQANQPRRLGTSHLRNSSMHQLVPRK